MYTLIILLSIFLFFILIGNFSIKFNFYFNSEEESYIYVKYLFLKFNIFPTKNKLDKKEKKCENQKDEFVKPDKKKKVDKDDKDESILKNLNIVKDLINPIKKYLKRLKKDIIIDDLIFIWRIVKADAAETAIFYGRVSSFFYPFLSVLNEIFVLNIKYVRLYPDFFNDKSLFNSSFKLKIKLYKLLFSTVCLLFSGLTNILSKRLKINKRKIKIKEK